jgi:hypothetical protein
MEEQKVKKERDILKWVLVGLAVFIVLALVFKIGMFVGEKRAQFSYRWAENYHRMFAGPKAGLLKDWRKVHFDDFIESHGTFGEIIKIDGNNLIVKGRRDIEKVIIVSEKTVIKSGFKNIKLSDLKIGDIIVIIGSPNEKGQIEAKIIRVFPPKSGFKGKFYE